MKKLLILLSFFTIFLYGQRSEPSVYDMVQQHQTTIQTEQYIELDKPSWQNEDNNPNEPKIELHVPIDEDAQSTTQPIEFEKNIEISYDSSAIFLSYINRPTRVYKDQIFELKLKALIAIDFEDMKTEFEDILHVELFNPNSPWVEIAPNHYENTYYLKALQNDAKLPKILLTLVKDSVDIEGKILEPFELQIISLIGDRFYSGVLAQNLNLTRYKTTRFDTNSLITVVELDSKNANLENFHFKDVIKSGIEHIEGEFPDRSMVAYAIFNDNESDVIFTYFNLEANKFERITLPVVLEESEVSTQTGLNPNESAFNRYNELLMLIFGIIFILISILKKRYYYLIISAILFGYLIYLNFVFSTITIKENSRIRILPMEKSTIFFTIDQPTKVQKIGTSGDFIKLLFDDGRIGWVRSSSVSKN